jgi:hypothetical protein
MIDTAVQFAVLGSLNLHFNYQITRLPDYQIQKTVTSTTVPSSTTLCSSGISM